MQLYLQDFDRLRSKLSLNRLNLPLSINDPALNKGEVFALYGKGRVVEEALGLIEGALAIFGGKALGTFKLEASEFYKKDDPYYQLCSAESRDQSELIQKALFLEAKHGEALLDYPLSEVEAEAEAEKTHNPSLELALPRPLLEEEGYLELATDYALILFLLDPDYKELFTHFLALLAQEESSLLAANSDKGKLLDQEVFAKIFELRKQETSLSLEDFAPLVENFFQAANELTTFASSLGTGQPGTSQLGTSQPVTDQPSTDQSGISQLGVSPLELDFFSVKELEAKGKVFICDMDSTAIYEEGLDLVAHKLGLGKEVEAITKEAMEGRLDFGESFRKRVALLADKEASLLTTMASELTINPALPFVTSYLKAQGYQTILCSGGLVPFASYIAQLGGFADFKANQLEVYQHQGISYFSGKTLPPLVDAYFKEKTLLEALLATEELEASQKTMVTHYLEQVKALTSYEELAALAPSLPANLGGIAAGDGANDIPMLKRAALGLAYQAKPIVKDYAQLKVERSNLIALVLALEVRKLFQ